MDEDEAINIKKYKQDLEEQGRDVTYLEDFMDAFPDGYFDDVKLTREQLQEIKATAIDNLGIQNTLPKVCDKEDCEFKKTCIFYNKSIAPEGEPCPEEKLLIQKLIPELIDNFKIDKDNLMEVNQIHEYIDHIITEHRARKRRALKGDVIRVATGTDKDGNALYEKKINPSFEAQRWAKKMKRQKREDFLATKKMREKHDLGGKKDIAEEEAELMEKAREMDEAEDVEMED